MTVNNSKKLGITDVVLRDAHQSLLATRMRIDDMLPIAAKLDQVGYWSLESWGGATFDACIRFLGEDPWDRIREFKKAMPNTPQQMLLRGQNILGYRHYADDVVEKFVERCVVNGVDVFRVFDAMNDTRNMETALKAVVKQGGHAQGTISYTLSPVHNIDLWVDLARKIEDLGAHSLAIKDMAGLLKPYTGFELVTRLKQALDIPIHMHCHATTGLSTSTIIKCVEAGIDNVDTSISSMSMTYGHSPTESVVAILQGTERDTGLDLALLEEIAQYFRKVRKKYAKFEGSLRGVDSRILLSQVPGGMLTNMESQLAEQGMTDRFDDVLAEIPKVREDLGFIPLVTPTSQIVGTQAVMNVLHGERYKSISNETAGILKGEYGATPFAVNKELQAQVLNGAEPISCRPADLLSPEMDRLREELVKLADESAISLAADECLIDDVLSYALFPQVGLNFLKNRGNPAAFEPAPTGKESSEVLSPSGEAVYSVELEGEKYTVTVSNGGEISGIVPLNSADTPQKERGPQASKTSPILAPMTGQIVSIEVEEGENVEKDDTLIVLEAMKMETIIHAPRAGTIAELCVSQGDFVAAGDELISLYE